MAGAKKHRERSRYRYHKDKPFLMFARKAYNASIPATMKEGSPLQKILHILRRNREAATPAGSEK